jgi:hypothetical protein
VKTLRITPDEVPGFEDAIDENGWVRVIPGVLDGELVALMASFCQISQGLKLLL